MIKLTRKLSGKILDIGGGGEGIIGRLYGASVTAIDNCPEELDEAPQGFNKILMDATDMTFPDSSFDNATFFFALMYMSSDEQKQSISEAARVLKSGGEIHIWDVDIVSAYPEPFLVSVKVALPEETILTTYGIKKIDVQSEDSIIRMCKDARLTLEKKENTSEGFYLIFKKP